MSFGVGVGDIIKIIELTKDLRKSFVDAPRQLHEVSQELKALSIVLDDVEITASQHDLSATQTSHLQELIAICQTVLRDLDKTLSKYYDVGKSGGSLVGRSKRIWRRLNVEPRDISEIRSRITSTISLLNTFMTGISNSTMLGISRGLERLNQDIDLKKQQKILNWISDIDSARVLADRLSRKQPGTGQWFLDSKEYESWTRDPGTTLFCPGVPGAGKTMISSIVIENLINRFDGNASVGIAYHFCDYRRSEEQSAHQILSSLLKQVTGSQLTIPTNIRDLYEEYGGSGKRPTLETIVEALRMACSIFDMTVIIIDALDETTSGDRKTILASMQRLQSNRMTSFLATSRPIPDIVDHFANSTSLQIIATPEDLRRYLEACIDQLPSFVQRNAALKIDIASKISAAADGIFLLAALYIRSLDDKMTPKAIKIALNEFHQPRDTASDTDDRQRILHSAYEQTMERITKQKPGFARLAIRVLSWITLAKTPILSFELQDALTVEIGEAELDRENMPEIEDMVSVCAGLVTIDKDRGAIRLIHFTVQEYLEKTKLVWFPDAPLEIARVCITYLSLDDFANECCDDSLTNQTIVQRLERYSFYAYAARYWSSHIVTDDKVVDELVLKLFHHRVKSKAISHAIFPFGIMYETSGLHLAAYFGNFKALSSLITRGESVHSLDFAQKTPLVWAACGGQLPMVQFLLEKGAKVNVRDLDGFTPLSAAVICNADDVVQLLIENGADLEEENWYGSTPLMIATEYDYDSIVQTLLDRGANGDAFNHQGKCPMTMAIEHNNKAIVRALLEKGAGRRYRYRPGSTACLEALSQGHEAAVYLLLSDETLNPNLLDECLRSALSWACVFGFEKAVAALIADKRVSPDQKDFYGSTPLSLAARHGHVEAVETLLSVGNVQADSEDDFGRSPFSFAVLHGHTKIVTLLIDNMRTRVKIPKIPPGQLSATSSYSQLKR